MDMNSDKSNETNEAPEASTETSDISEEEIKRILGKDLADLILTKSATDSVSCSDSLAATVPKTNNVVR